MIIEKIRKQRVKSKEHICDLCLVVPVDANTLCELCGKYSDLK